MQDPLTSVGAGWRFVQLLWTFKDRWVSPFLSRHLTPCTVVHIQSSPEWRRLQQCLKWSLQPCRPMTKAAWFPARTGQFTRQSTTLVHTSVCLLNQAVCSVKELIPSRAPVAHTYNPSYSGGRNQEDHGLKSVWENSSWDSISKKTLHNKGLTFSGSRCRPWVQNPNCKKKTKKKSFQVKVKQKLNVEHRKSTVPIKSYSKNKISSSSNPFPLGGPKFGWILKIMSHSPTEISPFESSMFQEGELSHSLTESSLGWGVGQGHWVTYIFVSFFFC
jgi:hypothetical protein